MPSSGFRNITSKQLFSSDYLLTRLPKSADWRHSATEREMLDSVKRVFMEAGALVDTGLEETVRDEVINKILALVNPFYLSGQTLPTGIPPDYIFFADAKSKQSKDLRKAIAVGEAKPPGKDFDKSSGERSPVRQTYDYMIDSQTGWGILTDGRRWRLLNRDSTTDKYLEVDLYEIAKTDNRDEWLYFYNLFRREAFVLTDGKSFLDRVKEENGKYEQSVGKELKDRVYGALRSLAQGFVDWPENHLNPSSEEVRKRIRGACFILLYRLLFVFFAEARDLLPRDVEGYRQMSLEALREKVKGASRDARDFSSDSRQLWTAMQDLFRLIDRGNARLGIAPYNGGLFSRGGSSLPHAEFLEHLEIGDKYLAAALDLLGTAHNIENKEELVNVDYAGLEIRHLGSIYEGLLEFQIAHADSDLVSVKSKKGELWIPASSYAGRVPLDRLPLDRRVRKGELYLETTRHERRATGSYYTTDPIVRYIVLYTVGPVIREKLDLAKVGKLRLSDAILSIRVCDPAMGSGHFLVEAVQVLAEALITAIVEDQKAELLSPSEYDINWAKREVVRRCIYGVDMNDLAVELAKVSLWLATVSRDKPLSFLDHRLKLGNSLLGTDLARLKRFPRSKDSTKTGNASQSLPDFISQIFVERLIEKIKELEGVRDDSLEDVKRKERIFAEFGLLPEYEKAKAIADVWTSVYFGNKIGSTDKKSPKDVYYDLIYALDYPSNWEAKAKTSWFRRAAQLAEDKRFFHWELEFPEVFLAEGGGTGSAGFDVVVGNPPYVSALEHVKISDPGERELIRARFAAKGAFDLYIPFIELGQRLVGKGDRSGLITPNKVLAAPYAKSLRRLLAANATLDRVLDASQADVFEDPAVYPIVTVFCKRPPLEADRILVESLAKGETTPTIRGTFPHSLLAAFPDLLWGFLLSKTVELTSRLATQCKHLDPDIATVQASTTAAESELFSTILLECEMVPHESGHFRVVNTGLIDRYENRWGLQPLTHARRQYKKPCIKKDEPRLSQMRRDLYSQPKLIVAKVAYVPEICLDPLGEFAAVNVNFVLAARVDLRFLLAILNSKLMNHIYREYFGALTMQRGYAQFQAPQLRILPIPDYLTTSQVGERRALLSQAFALAEGAETIPDEVAGDLVDNWTIERMRGIAERKDVIPDALAFLANIMARQYQAKSAASGRFVNWIQSPAGLDLAVRSLRGRDKIQNFAEDLRLGTEDGRRTIERVFAENGITLKSSQLTALSEEYSKTSTELVPILQRIARVDRLINFLVYRLYGLTLQEAAIVEGLTEDGARREYLWQD